MEWVGENKLSAFIFKVVAYVSNRLKIHISRAGGQSGWVGRLTGSSKLILAIFGI